MKAGLLLLAAVLVVTAFLVFRQGAARRDEPPLPPVVFLSTESESRERAEALLPAAGSEDRSDLLAAPDLPPFDPSVEREYLPDMIGDWTVYARFEGDPAFDRDRFQELAKRLGEGSAQRPSVYGKASVTGRWTFLVSSDAPERFTELAFAWSYVPRDDESWTPPVERVFRDRATRVSDALSELGEHELRYSVPIETAVSEAARLGELRRRLDREAIIVVRAPNDELYDGRDVWDVLQSIGLEWGDMDLFHWRNEAAVGDDAFFSVWTSSEPGFFLPEEVAAGRMKLRDLVFGFSIPRSAAPVVVLESMLRSGEYAVERLGGRLVAADESPLDATVLRAEVKRIVRELRAAGLEPGGESALRFF